MKPARVKEPGSLHFDGSESGTARLSGLWRAPARRARSVPADARQCTIGVAAVHWTIWANQQTTSNAA